MGFQVVLMCYCGGERFACAFAGSKTPGGLRSLCSLRTLPPFPASSLRENLSPAGPVPLPVAEGGHASGHLTPGHRLRTDYSDGDPYFEEPFYILKHTYCAAVLTENGFMDCEVSLKYLESDEGKQAIIALHVEGIIVYIESM